MIEKRKRAARAGPVKLSVHPETYKYAREGAEGCDPTWMLEDADEVYGMCLHVLASTPVWSLVQGVRITL